MHTRTEPAGRRAAASELAADIRSRHRSLLRELRVDVVEGGVILHGHAYSFYGKQVALHEVIRGGVAVVANRMTVSGRAHHYHPSE